MTMEGNFTSLIEYTSSMMSLVENITTISATTELSTNMSYLRHHHNVELNPYTNNFSYYPINCPNPEVPMRIGRLISMILYTLVFLIGLLGNSLVIYVVLRFSKMKTVTNIYILNLAIADECYLIGVPILISTMHLSEWIFGEYVCKFYMVSTSITQFTSSIFLLIMSADRFIAVCHPINSPRFRTTFVSKIVSLIAWCLSAILITPIILYANIIVVDDLSGKKTCNIIWPSSSGHGNSTTDDELIESDGSTFILYSFTFAFAIPLSLILIFYYLVLRKLKTVGPKTKSKEKKRSHRKVTKLVLTVIAVYILCWTPYWVSQMALIHSPPDICKSKLEITIFILVGCLGYSNSAMNPVLYAFLSDNFKKSFLKACTCAKRDFINNQLQVENSFFPRFGRSRESERFSSKPTTNLISNVNSLPASKLNSAKFGFTTESIIDATYTNGHHENNGNHINNNNHSGNTDDEEDDEVPQQQPTEQRGHNLITITTIGDPFTNQLRLPVLHTDL